MTDVQDNSPTGCLYLVATPIGNLEDITLRALRVLKEADLIACEDTRQTQKLLQHYAIHKEMVSYHAHNELTRAPELVIQLEEGAQVALVSDAGTPVVSDPGHRLGGSVPAPSHSGRSHPGAVRICGCAGGFGDAHGGISVCGIPAVTRGRAQEEARRFEVRTEGAGVL